MAQQPDQQPVVQKVKDSASRQVNEVAIASRDAVHSMAWSYPIRGIFYTLGHPGLLIPLVPSLVQALLMSIGVLAGMFFFTYLPQVAVLAVVTGPLAFIGAIPLVLGESWIILTFLTRTFLLAQAALDIFDSVLITRNHQSLVKNGRQLSSTSNASGRKITKFGKALTTPLANKWFFSIDGIVKYALTLPLNAIPVVGTAFFLGYNGMNAGPGYHERYFQLKGLDKQARADFVKAHRGAYTAFGTAAMALNLIPIVSVLFTLTNSVGAALWASDMERNSRSEERNGVDDIPKMEETTVDFGDREVAGKKDL